MSAWDAVAGPAKQAVADFLGDVKRQKADTGNMSYTEAIAQMLRAYREYPIPPDQEAYIRTYEYIQQLERQNEQLHEQLVVQKTKIAFGPDSDVEIMKTPLRKVARTTKSTRLSGIEKITFHLECNHEITRTLTPRMKHPRKMRCRMCEAIALDVGRQFRRMMQEVWP